MKTIDEINNGLKLFRNVFFVTIIVALVNISLSIWSYSDENNSSSVKTKTLITLIFSIVIVFLLFFIYIVSVKDIFEKINKVIPEVTV
jgi:hypothetical protein